MVYHTHLSSNTTSLIFFFSFIPADASGAGDGDVHMADHAPDVILPFAPDVTNEQLSTFKSVADLLGLKANKWENLTEKIERSPINLKIFEPFGMFLECEISFQLISCLIFIFFFFLFCPIFYFPCNFHQSIVSST